MLSMKTKSVDSILAAKYGSSPLPSWSMSFSLTNSLLKTFLSLNRSNLSRLRMLADIPMPNASGTRSFEFEIKPETFEGVESREMIQAEWVSCTESNTPDKNDKIILYLHGGGYFMSSRKTHRHLTGNLCKATGAFILVVDYRRSPEHEFPAALHDSISCYKYLLSHGYDASNIYFAGDSSGGGLSISSSLWIRDSDLPLPGGIIALSPWLDLTLSQPSFLLNRPFDYLSGMVEFSPKQRIHHYTSNSNLTNPLVSPIYAHESSREMPRILIQVGSHELLRDECILFHEKFSKTTLEIYNEMPHVFHLFSAIESVVCEYAFERIRLFLADNNNAKQALEVSKKGSFVETSVLVEPSKILNAARKELCGLRREHEEINGVFGLLPIVDQRVGPTCECCE